MYEVTSIIKTLFTTTDLDEALRRAECEFETRKYVEVKEIISVAPWVAYSVKILAR